MPLKCKTILLFLFCGIANLIYGQINIDHWETAVFAEDTWRYRVGSSEPPSSWMQPGFNDTAWSLGPGGFGYGDDDDNTIVPTTLSIYIRIKFDIVDISKINMAVLHADYDDAFVAYLNGQEFARGNFPETGVPPAHDEIPPTDHEAALYNGGLPEAFPIFDTSLENLLQEGENTLAIQVHNFLITSSDLSSNFFFSLGINDTSMDYDPTPDWFYEPFVATSLPLVLVNTNGQVIVDEPRIVADMKIVDNGPGTLNYLSDPASDYEGKIAIEIRGASSQFFSKKNYGFETQDELGENLNYPLLGMPEENDWILHGPYSDKSLIRNALTFDLGRKMMDYASRTRFCELFINQDYRGIYLMMERIKRDASRVDISNLRPEDIAGDELTGGYIIQIDRDNPDEDDGWYSPYGSNPFYAYHHPNFDNLMPVQKDYIREWISDFEFAMLQPNYEETYDNYIDVESFIDYFLINELTKHVDAFKLSFYMYKRKDSNGGKLHMGPIWDFNLGYGNFDFECDPEPPGWIYPCTNRAFWLTRILEIEEVQNQMFCRWQELRNSYLATSAIMNTIDDMNDELGEAKDRNFTRWNILDQYIWPNYFVGATYDEELDYLKSWLTERLDWMDNNMFGQTTDCTTAASDLVTSFDMEVFPNPFNNEVNFVLTNEGTQTGTLTIHNALGQVLEVFTVTSNDLLTWNTRSYSSGVYFYTLNLNEKNLSGRLFKQ